MRRFGALFACSVAVPLLLASSPASAGSWAQFHRGASRSGLTRTEILLTRDTVGSLKQVWSFATGETAEGINSSPAVAGGMVYVGSDDGRLWAADARTGEVAWSVAVGSQVRSSPAVGGGRVFFGSEGGAIYAVDAGTGSPLWSYGIGGNVTAAPLFVGGKVYVGSRGGTFVALDAASGRELWRARPWGVWAGASYANGVVFFGSEQSKVWAYEADTGRLLWSTELDGRVRSAPSVSGGRLFVGTDGGTVWSLDASDGSVRWQTRAAPVGSGAVIRSSPAVAGGRVFVATAEVSPMDGDAVAFDADTGQVVWRNDSVADYSTSSPAVANGVVYLGSYDTRLYAFHAGTGRLLWTLDWGTENLPRGINSSPAIANGFVYVGCRDGSLYAFGLPSRMR